jgi:hypothetical protein
LAGAAQKIETILAGAAQEKSWHWPGRHKKKAGIGRDGRSRRRKWHWPERHKKKAGIGRNGRVRIKFIKS